MMEKENIIHIDMDAFFASVEQNDNPELIGKPVAVCGKKSVRAVVSTASYEARKFGVHSAMPVRTALKKCPNLILIEGRFTRYAEISKKIYDILLKYTPIVERASIDEAYLDVTGSHLLFGATLDIAKSIRDEIKKNLSLSCSIGIAPNKLLAKIASDLKKPGGITIVKYNEIEKFLHNLRVEKLPGIGPKTSDILHSKGIYYISDLKKIKLPVLKKVFGKYGERLYYMARGIDDSNVLTQSDDKSISNEITLEYDTTDLNEIKKIMLQLSDKVAERIRKKGIRAKTVQIKIKYFDFKSITRQISFNEYIDDSKKIFEGGIALLNRINIRPIRLVGIGVSNFEKAGDKQLLLFGNKVSTAEKAIDKINERYGKSIIKKATNIGEKGL